MTKRRVGYTFLTMAAVALSALLTGIAAADPPDKKDKQGKPDKQGAAQDPQSMMAAVEKAGQPAEEHKQLLKMVGKWNLAFKSWMDPKAPPMDSTGTAESKAILGDRFVQTTVTSTFMGKPFSGVAINGYDKAKKKFVGTWMDSMSTGISVVEGTADASGKVITSQMKGTDPVTGKETRMRIVGRWESDDKLVEEFHEKKGGKEVKMMEITYTRAK
jgi:Protein of unknown function (DUF1579)